MTTKINKFAYDIVNTNISNAINRKEKEINDNTIAFFKKKYQKETDKYTKAMDTARKNLAELKDKIKDETKEIKGMTVHIDGLPYPSTTLEISISTYSHNGNVPKHPAIIKANEDKQQILMKLALGEDITEEVNALIKTINNIK